MPEALINWDHLRITITFEGIEEAKRVFDKFVSKPEIFK